MTDSNNPDGPIDDTPPDAREDLKKAQKLRNSVLSAIQQFENQLLTAVQESPLDDEENAGSVSPVPEFLDEEKDQLREALYESIRHIFLNAQDSSSHFSSRFYEEAVYTLVADRIRRMFGYYNALRRAEEEILQNNQQIGDPKALEIALDSIQKLLAGLDEVDFVRNLGVSLGIFTPDLDEIVKHVIRKEFAPIRRREIEE
jgi:hypothetical protein